MPGICTSAITHERSSRWFDSKNSSADANAYTKYPSDLTRLSVVARTDASSSMIATTGSFDKAVFPWRLGAYGVVALPEIASRIGIGKGYLGISSRVSGDGFRAGQPFQVNQLTTGPSFFASYGHDGPSQ